MRTCAKQTRIALSNALYPKKPKIKNIQYQNFARFSALFRLATMFNVTATALLAFL